MMLAPKEKRNFTPPYEPKKAACMKLPQNLKRPNRTNCPN
jgi:hypothetical protein